MNERNFIFNKTKKNIKICVMFEQKMNSARSVAI